VYLNDNLNHYAVNKQQLHNRNYVENAS